MYPSQKADLVEERSDMAQSRIDPQNQTAPRADCSGWRDGSRRSYLGKQGVDFERVRCRLRLRDEMHLYFRPLHCVEQ